MINRHAVLHIPLSHYAYASARDQLTIRLRAAAGNLTSCKLLYGDRCQETDPICFTPLPMKVVASDKLFDYYEVTFQPGITRVCYYFELSSDLETTNYCADLFISELPPTRSEFYQYPFIRREEVSDVPAWFKHAVVYNIFPDSFATSQSELSCKSKAIILRDGVVSKSALGGTLRGITQNLKYIRNLGFNCIYLNPIFAAGEYHKYDLIDYFHVDPCFGTDEDFAELVDTAHGMGLRVIIDGVFNHSGMHFFAFEDVIKNGEDSKYVDWFYSLQFPVKVPKNGEHPNYSCFAYEPKMPKLNSSNPDTRNFFLSVCRYWIRNYHIDGWRLDVANELDRNFWRAFRITAKSENPECVLIGEIWENAEVWLRGDMFDSTMNYDFRKHCREFFALGSIDAEEFNGRTTQMLMRYPKGIVQGQLNLLDSHDVSRFLSLCGGNVERFQLAILFLSIFPGVPSVFYGDELGVTGVTEPEYRQAMPWGRNSDLSGFYKKAMALRRNSALVDGDYSVLSAEPGSHVYAVRRCDNAQKITLILNAGIDDASVSEINLPQVDPYWVAGLNDGYLNGLGFAIWVENSDKEYNLV